MGTPCKPYGNPKLITHRDLQKVYTINKYHFPIFIFIYYIYLFLFIFSHIYLILVTVKNLVTHIN